MAHDDDLASPEVLIAEVQSRLMLNPQPAILVVDDDPINLGLVELLFKRVNVSIDTAIDGIDALEKLTGCDYGLIFMDIHMPHLDGLSTTKAIRKQPKYSDLPIIALSGADSDRDVELANSASMSDYIFRPLTLAKLLSALLKHWVPASPATPVLKAASIAAPSCSLDTSKNIGELFQLAEFSSEHTAYETLGNDAYLRIVKVFIKDMDVRLPQWQAETVWTLESKKSFAHRIYGTSCALGAVALSQISKTALAELNAGHDFEVGILIHKLQETVNSLHSQLTEGR